MLFLIHIKKIKQMDFSQFIGILVFLAVFTMGFWLMILLTTFILPYWVVGAIKEKLSEGKKKKNTE
jgi:uncharacterized membrane protein